MGPLLSGKTRSSSLNKPGEVGKQTVWGALIGVLVGSALCSAALSQESAVATAGVSQASGLGSDPRDPSNFFESNSERRTERDSLLPASPLGPLRDWLDATNKDLYEAAGLNIGLTFNHLFQHLSDVRPGLDDNGVTTDVDLLVSWALYNKGLPNQGKIYGHLEGRWDYGTTGPQDLGFANLGSQIGTGNAFSAYQPAVILRNMYWEQGSPEAGWSYRIGKITTDSILGTSKHITPVTTFLPNAGTGFFVDGFPDSGFGLVGARYFNDRFKVIGLIADANGNRFDWGFSDLGEGDLYTAIEVAAKILPGTGRADFSKLTVWHTDGTKDGAAINASTGESGWGYSAKYEQELTADGNAIGILRWGQSYGDSALYEQQAGVNFLYYDPGLIGSINNDVVGVGLNWVNPTAAGARDETAVEVFYRFPVFPDLDMTLSYQYVHHPALAPDINHASVFSLRLRSVF